MWTGFSYEVRLISDFSQLTGGWKAVVVSNPETPSGSIVYYLNMDISGSEDAVTVVLDWDSWKLSSTGDLIGDPSTDSVYSGKWNSNSIYAEGMGSISIYDFYYDRGAQYGLATVFWPDNSYGVMAFVRP